LCRHTTRMDTSLRLMLSTTRTVPSYKRMNSKASPSATPALSLSAKDSVHLMPFAAPEHLERPVLQAMNVTLADAVSSSMACSSSCAVPQASPSFVASLCWVLSSIFSLGGSLICSCKSSVHRLSKFKDRAALYLQRVLYKKASSSITMSQCSYCGLKSMFSYGDVFLRWCYLVV